jgi:hypothetical protein
VATSGNTIPRIVVERRTVTGLRQIDSAAVRVEIHSLTGSEVREARSAVKVETSGALHDLAESGIAVVSAARPVTA